MAAILERPTQTGESRLTTLPSQARVTLRLDQLYPEGVISPLDGLFKEAQMLGFRFVAASPSKNGGHRNGANGHHQVQENMLGLPHHQVSEEVVVSSPRYTVGINSAGATFNMDQVATKAPSNDQAETIYPLINLLNEINQRARFKREDISKSASEREAQLDEAQAWVEQIEKEYKDERGHFTNKSVGREIKNMKRRIKYQRGKIKPDSTSKNVNTEEIQPVANSQVDSGMADDVKEITNKVPSLDQAQRAMQEVSLHREATKMPPTGERRGFRMVNRKVEIEPVSLVRDGYAVATSWQPVGRQISLPEIATEITKPSVLTQIFESARRFGQVAAAALLYTVPRLITFKI